MRVMEGSGVPPSSQWIHLRHDSIARRGISIKSGDSRGDYSALYHYANKEEGSCTAGGSASGRGC